MKKYKVLNDCFGFKKKLWEKDTIVELEDNEIPPIHFELINDGLPIIKEETIGETYSGLQKKQKDLSQPKSGFAGNASEIIPDIVITRSPEKKRK